MKTVVATSWVDGRRRRVPGGKEVRSLFGLCSCFKKRRTVIRLLREDDTRVRDSRLYLILLISTSISLFPPFRHFYVKDFDPRVKP